MRDSKYSVLFMRDDTNVKRFRLSPFWLRMFLFSQLFLLIFAAGGAYMTYRMWQTNAGLRGDKRQMEQRLVDAEVRLERLGNMEKILKSYDPNELQTLLSSASAEPEPQVDALNLADVIYRVDTRRVAVENLQVKLARKKVTVSFELNNLQVAKQVTGEAFFTVIKKDGATVDIDANRNDLKFQIQRFKRIRTTFLLPDDLQGKDIFGLRLEIKGSDDKVIFLDAYPLYRILS